MLDRMSPKTYARAKQQAATTNQINELAHDANGFGTTRAEKNAAQRRLAAMVGDRKAKKLIRDAAKKAAS